MIDGIATALTGVTLRPMRPSEAADLGRVIRENRAHLTRNGDYGDLVEMTDAELAAMLERAEVAEHYFGVFDGRILQGIVSLVPVDPPRYGSGYWLAEAATGRGIATEAMRSLLEHARMTLGATDVFAGVTHGNTPSIRLLERLGFQESERFESYTRFHLAFGSGAPTRG
ncbi:hypothetical protein ASE14_13450 [Agromyces sp. Root81]|uniref:GNAT family N-acetyltransferase n=1 Tax=Agromyces sp. Root81 TaxID=1736601 RepID=UPI0006FFB218|nr:GNAT family N-acetyltransferase [Agromyces sp. Root81]KRC61811.1 hypothetical protein ASE14_13450 [Agromyces sp. Root81]